MGEGDRLAAEHGVVGTPGRGLALSTLVSFAGLTTIVFYGAAGPVVERHLALTGVLHGLLLGSPHLGKAFLRVPFGAEGRHRGRDPRRAAGRFVIGQR